MTVALTSPRFSYDGDDTTTQFGTPYFLANSDLVVILRDANDSTTTWTLGTQYTLSGAGDENGGTLTVVTTPTDYTPATGETLVIATSPPLTQGTDYPSGGTFPSVSTENAFDKLTLIAQYLQSLLDRTFLVPVADAGAGQLGTLPIDTSRANMALGFDASGNPIAIPAAGVSTHTVQDLFAGDASTVNFTLSSTPLSESSTFVFIDGVRQQTNSYSLSGTTLTFSEAPPGDGVEQNIEVVHLQEVEFGAPADGTITTAKFASGAVGDATVTATGSTTARALDDRFADVANVADFGNDIQAAIDSLPARGGIVYLPPGLYSVTSDLSLADGVVLQGAFGWTSSLGSAITLSSNASILMGGLKGAGLDSLYISSDSAADPAVDFTDSSTTSAYCFIHNCNIVGGQFCVKFHNCLEIRVSRCRMVTISGSTHVVRMEGADGGVGSDAGIDAVEFVQCVFGSAAEANADIIDMNGDVASVKMHQCVVLFGAKGIVMRQVGATTREPRFFYFSGGGFENQDESCVDIANGSMIKFTNFYASNDAPSGVNGDVMRLGSGGDVLVSNGEIRGGARDGIRVFNGTNATITGCHIGNNGRAETGRGVTITAAGKVVLTGNNIGGFSDGSNAQTHGVSLVSQVNPVVIEGNHLDDNVTGGLTGTVPAGSIVRNNLGHVSEKWDEVSGVTPNGSGEHTFNHGLDGTPSWAVANIKGDTATICDVVTITATQITVRFKDSGGADVTTGPRTFYWQARL